VRKSLGLFHRYVESAASWVFWAIINTVCLIIKLQYWRPLKGTNGISPAGEEIVRVGFCENGAGYGGAIISLAALLEKLPNRFHSFIYTGLGHGKYPQLRSLGRWRHVRPVSLVNPGWLKKRRVPFGSSVDNIFNILPHALKYYLKFKRDKISYVYLNNDLSCNFAPAIAARVAGIPIVLHARGFNHDTRGNRWVLSILHHCIAVSSAVRAELIELGLPPEKCSVVPEGLDLNMFRPRQPFPSLKRELDLSDDQPVISLVGGLVDWKGQDVLLDAVPLVLAEFPKALFLLVGNAYGKDDSFARQIAYRAALPQMQSRVRLLGARDDVSDILACSSIVVHASTKPEPFGRTFLEGMAMAKAVIASNEGGPLDVITHEVDGLLIQPRDHRKLAAAIVRLLKDPAFSASLGKNAHMKAAAYSIEHHARQVADILAAIHSANKDPFIFSAPKEV
jgi:glycosyltransferase involved in cell wall biosynthesis